MREYDVHFSFYNEQYGNFDDTSYKVMADNPFEAREKAWPLCDQDSETLFRSNIKQYAVTWQPNLLDAGDYFYAQAASVKQSMGNINNVQIPNARISNPEYEQSLKAQHHMDFGSLHAIDFIAKDLYADKGMVPPSVYEELHYSEKLCESLGWGEKADALWERMDKAKKWDNGAKYALRDLFKDGHTWLCGETVTFREQFDRHGIYPIHNKLDEYDYTYTSRWQRARKVDSLNRLQTMTISDVIAHSAEKMDLYGQTLLLNSERFAGKYNAPENMLWTHIDISETGEAVPDSGFTVENPITGERMTCAREDFIGVLRPEIAAGFDFNALKNAFAQREQGEKPSILTRLQEAKDKAAQEPAQPKTAPIRDASLTV